MLPPLIIYRADKNYTPEIAAQIAGERPPSQSAPR
jgi:hypothetical protein